MKISVTTAATIILICTNTYADPGDRVERHLDNKGHRIENRLDRKGDRIENRLDHKGDRINDRLDSASDRTQTAGHDKLARRLDNTKEIESIDGWTARVSALIVVSKHRH